MLIFEKVEHRNNSNATVASALMILFLCTIIFTAPYYLVLAFKPTPPTEQTPPQNTTQSQLTPQPTTNMHKDLSYMKTIENSSKISWL